MTNTPEPVIFIDGKFNDPQECPKSNGGMCPKCGTQLEGGYGFAGGYGLGVYSTCPSESCPCIIYDFMEDEG